ncbi:MAG TPA: hypothetical protein PKD55_13880 [Bellilinea sp.]|nr:hypothetical protein [Bellilinea sp.]
MGNEPVFDNLGYGEIRNSERQVFWMMASNRSLLAVLLLFCVGLTPVYADTDRGLEIAKTMRERDRGFGDFTADMEMALIDTGGKETLRRLRVRTLERVGRDSCQKQQKSTYPYVLNSVF